MAKTPPEKLAAALRANLKRRKPQCSSVQVPDPAKDPEKFKGNSPYLPSRPPLGT
jgi:hypothetical protein